jgi:AhpC/TSA family
MTEKSSFTILDGGRVTAVGEAEGAALAKQAETSGRPVAVDLDERAAYLGINAAERAKALASLEAPDFTLPDLDGRSHSLSAQRGKKVLLVAYASW